MSILKNSYVQEKILMLVHLKELKISDKNEYPEKLICSRKDFNVGPLKELKMENLCLLETAIQKIFSRQLCFFHDWICHMFCSDMI